MMEQQNHLGVHDTINIEELRALIEDPVEDKEVKREEASKKPSEPVRFEPSAAKSKGLIAELYDMLHDLIYILAGVTLLFVFVVRLVGVEGSSMVPTLQNRDYLLLESNFWYGVDDIQCGDIVVLNVPYYWEREKSLIVKRVIATEGQTVDIDYETSKVYVDGVCLQEDYINEQTIRRIWDGPLELELPATVPEGHIFVLGDNRNNSSDSRFAPVGMIDERCVLGKAWLIAIPGQTKDEFGNIISPRDWSRIGLVS